jgi:hypothetical protein
VGDGRSLWDWFDLPNEGVALVTLDAGSGAFFPAHRLGVVRGFLREFGPSNPDAERLLESVNGAVSRTAAPGLDAAVETGVLILGTGEMTWAGGGAVRAGLIRRTGLLEELPSLGPPLGLLDGFRFGTVNVTLEAGDVVVVHSHGGRGLFRGAADLVAEMRGKPGREIMKKLQTALQRASGEDSPRERSVLFVRSR